MKSRVKEIWKIVQGLIVLAVVFFLFIIALKYIIQITNDGFEQILQTVSKADAVIIVALITGTLSILGVVISSIIAKVVEYRQKTKRYLFEKREDSYAKFIDLVYKVMDKTKKNEEYTESEMAQDMLSFSKQLSLWGSSRVIKKWLKFRMASQNSDFDPIENLFIMEDIIFDIRKDMGQKRNGLKRGDMLAFFINDIQDILSKYKQV